MLMLSPADKKDSNRWNLSSAYTAQRQGPVRDQQNARRDTLTREISGNGAVARAGAECWQVAFQRRHPGGSTHTGAAFGEVPKAKNRLMRSP
jgi:hypothetical protein